MSKRIIDSKRISTNSLEMPDEYKLSISSSWSHVTVNESLPARLKGMRKASFFRDFTGFHNALLRYMSQALEFNQICTGKMRCVTLGKSLNSSEQ